MNTIEEFRSAISDKGTPAPDHIITDGRIHRFDVDRRGDKAGWYAFYPDGVAAGAFGNWKEGVTHKWSSKNSDMSTEERAAFKRRMAKAEKKRTTLKEKSQERAQKRAQIIWQRAKEALEDHPYVIGKGIKPHRLRQYKRMLIASLMTLEGEIQSLQFINDKGVKRFLKDGEVKGNLSWIKGDNTLCLCEGFATGASIHEATGHTVLISFNAMNLLPVAEKVRAKHPHRPLVICGDNDQWTTKSDGTPWNPGREKALSIGWKFNLQVAIPSFPDVENRPTDFNDLHQLAGIEGVKKQIEAAKHPKDILLDEIKIDPGAPYRKENIEGLRALKQTDLSAYVAYREKLKALKVGVTSLDKVIDGKGPGKSGGSFNHLDIARRVVEHYGPENIFNSGVFIWKWNGKGLWQKIDDREIKGSTHKVMKGADISKGVVESILDLTKTEIYRPNHQFDVDTTAINCLNGELHLTGEVWELREHERGNFRTTQIPVSYDPKAMAQRFERFLMEVFDKDPDQTEKAFLVCEALGYSLLSSTAYEKFFLLIGSGANGKSVLMETLAALVGNEHVAAVQPSQFENRFQRAHLHCKLVNLVTEIAEGHTIQDAELKSIVSGELTTAEHKHKPPFDFRPYATCWFGSNHMPHTRDFSDALFRRVMIIPFNRTFQEHEQDKHLKAKLREELPGILNLALEAVAGVFKRGEFTKTASCEKAKKEWRLNCDQVQQFADDECVFIPGAETTSKKLYKAYREWATDSGIKRTVNRNNFTARMCRLGAERAKGTGGTRLLAGVGLKFHVE